MTLRQLGILRAKDVPPVDVVLVERPQPRAPYGVKGVGEIGLVPTAGAVAGALHDRDGEWRSTLPMRGDGAGATRERRTCRRVHRRRRPPPPGSSARTTTSTRRSPGACRRRRPRPTDFTSILDQVWWRLDLALDLELVRWSALLGAVEALEAGTTAIVDHHASPSAIDGSLDVIAEACAEVGVRVVCAYEVTDRHGPDGAKAGLAENERFLRAGGRGLVGAHACLHPVGRHARRGRRGWPRDLGVGVHIHVGEDATDAGAADRLRPLRRRRLAARPLRPRRPAAGGHDRPQPPLEHEQRGRLRPPGPLRRRREPGRARQRRHRRRHGRRVRPGLRGPAGRRRDRHARRRVVVAAGRRRPRARGARRRGDVGAPTGPTRGTWPSPPGVRAERVVVDGEVVVDGGVCTRVDAERIRARAWEEAQRLWSML